jgi:hypothetical protein
MTVTSEESPWRQFLTTEERRLFKKIERAKARWRELNAHRNEILNRAAQRARYHARQIAMSPRERRRQRAQSERTP